MLQVCDLGTAEPCATQAGEGHFFYRSLFPPLLLCPRDCCEVSVYAGSCDPGSKRQFPNSLRLGLFLAVSGGRRRERRPSKPVLWLPADFTWRELSGRINPPFFVVPPPGLKVTQAPLSLLLLNCCPVSPCDCLKQLLCPAPEAAALQWILYRVFGDLEKGRAFSHSWAAGRC